MNFLLKVCLIASSVLLVGAQTNLTCYNTCSEPDPIEYYWRDYNGKIPCDAIQGGTDRSGNPTYIGQVYFEEYELLPATITPGNQRAVTIARDKEIWSDRNVKILCSQEKEKYQWIQTKNDETQLLTNCEFVVGGSELREQLHIGRVKYENEVVIGKVLSNPLPRGGLYIPHHGRSIKYLQYEILTYNCFVNCNTNCNDLPVQAVRYTAIKK